MWRPPRPNPSPIPRLRTGRTNRRLRPDRPNKVPITYTSGEQVEVYRFSIPVTVLVPVSALFLQAWLPRQWSFFALFDLPLLVTIFFSISRRNPVTGLLTGAAIGIFQDALTGLPLGVYGIAKTVVGYGASSLGVKLDVENAGARLLVTLFFYVVHEIVYFTVARGLVNLSLQWSGQHELGSGLANAVLGVLLYFVLDRFKQRT